MPDCLVAGASHGWLTQRAGSLTISKGHKGQREHDSIRGLETGNSGQWYSTKPTVMAASLGS